MQQAKFKTVALPFYAIVDAKGDGIITFPGLTRKEEEIVSISAIRSTKDMLMPVTDGLTANRIIRKLDGAARLPIIAFTAFGKSY